MLLLFLRKKNISKNRKAAVQISTRNTMCITCSIGNREAIGSNKYTKRERGRERGRNEKYGS